MEPMDDSHYPQELLEQYAAYGIPADKPAVTNHLIACDSCHEIYEAKLNTRQAPALANSGRDARRKQANLFTFPSPVWAAAGALFFLIFMNPAAQRSPGPAQILNIQAVRGGQTVQARHGVPLVLRLDTTGLEIPASVQVNVVNDRGRAVWTGSARQTDSVWKAETAKGLQPGRYWVRVPNPAQPGELLREFQLDIR